MKMRNSKGQVFSTRVVIFALIAFLALPLTAFGQYQRNNQRRDRREDRQDRREDRREDRQERREARRGNDRDGYPNWGGSFELRQTALNAGYNEGTKEGRKDRQKGDRFDYRDENTYQKATKDYSSKLGRRDLYQQYLRAAFENGYSDGYFGH